MASVVEIKLVLINFTYDLSFSFVKATKKLSTKVTSIETPKARKRMSIKDYASLEDVKGEKVDGTWPKEA